MLFASVDSNKYKFDFDQMAFVPKAPKEYLEKPFQLFWQAHRELYQEASGAGEES
jgi:hypothetical protein